MDNPTYWPQVLTIVIANVSVLLTTLTMFLWATRQARSDHLYMDKKYEDNRREMNAIMDKHTAFIERHIASNEEIIKSFDQRLQAKGK